MAIESETTELARVVGANVRRLRLLQGFSQHEFAKKCGMLPSHFCRLEKGQHLATLDRVLLIARELNVEVNELLATGKTKRKD